MIWKEPFAGILHTENDSLADVVQSDRTVILYGQDFFMEELLGLKFKITPFSFFQTNSLGAEVLYETAREYIGDTKGRKVFDLYSGTGTIAQIPSPAAEHVTGVEIVEEAVEAAKINAQRNGLTNCDFIAGDVLKVLDTLEERPTSSSWIHRETGSIRRRCRRLSNTALITWSTFPANRRVLREILLFSRQADTRQNGSAVGHVPLQQPGSRRLSCFPRVRGRLEKIRVEFSLEDMDMSEFQDGATYTQIKDYVLEHSGLKVSNLYISQIKRKCGIEVGKNYNLPKSEDSRQPMCPPEKEKAIREAFKYFGMI